MKKSILDIFSVKKPVIGMLHLDYLEGSPEYKGFEHVVSRAKSDIEKMQKGGIDGIIIENWKENSTGEFVASETANSLLEVCLALTPFITVPLGVNVLNNDYKVAFDIAKKVGASFVELDVLVDEVVSDFSHSSAGVEKPFEIKIKASDVFDYAKEIGAEDISVICFVQPKHYKMIDNNKTIEESVSQAELAGAVGVLVTKATGMSPTVDLIKKAKSASRGIMVGIGSGFSAENANEFLPFVDMMVVGSAIKIQGNADNEVDESKVRELVDTVNNYRLLIKNE